jgi:hypothetical protein
VVEEIDVPSAILSEKSDWNPEDVINDSSSPGAWMMGSCSSSSFPFCTKSDIFKYKS